MMALFVLFSILMLLSAVGVVVFRNSIYSALCLVLHLTMVAAMFAQLGAHFLAAVQIIVYAGAIMVLVLFVLMLLNVKVERPKPIGRGSIAMGILGAIGLLWFMLPALNSAFKVFPDAVTPVEGGAKEMGQLLYTSYLFPFEAASVLIMVAIAGAVMIAKRSYKASSALTGGK